MKPEVPGTVVQVTRVKEKSQGEYKLGAACQNCNLTRIIQKLRLILILPMHNQLSLFPRLQLHIKKKCVVLCLISNGFYNMTQPLNEIQRLTQMRQWWIFPFNPISEKLLNCNTLPASQSSTIQHSSAASILRVHWYIEYWYGLENIFQWVVGSFTTIRSSDMN